MEDLIRWDCPYCNFFKVYNLCFAKESNQTYKSLMKSISTHQRKSRNNTGLVAKKPKTLFCMKSFSSNRKSVKFDPELTTTQHRYVEQWSEIRLLLDQLIDKSLFLMWVHILMKNYLGSQSTQLNIVFRVCIKSQHVWNSI